MDEKKRVMNETREHQNRRIYQESLAENEKWFKKNNAESLERFMEAERRRMYETVVGFDDFPADGLTQQGLYEGPWCEKFRECALWLDSQKQLRYSHGNFRLLPNETLGYDEEIDKLPHSDPRWSPFDFDMTWQVVRAGDLGPKPNKDLD